MASKKKAAKKKLKKSEEKHQPFPPDMSFEDAVAMSIHTQISKKKKGK